jgi:hypothetical protein
MGTTFKSGTLTFITLLLIGTALIQEGHPQGSRGLLEAVRAAAVRGPLPADLTIEGTVIDAKGVKQIRILIKDRRKIRYELGAGPTLQITIFDNNQGWSIQGTRIQALQDHTSIRRPTIIPIFDLLAELENARLIGVDHGIKVRGSQAARHVTLTLPDSVQPRPFGRRLDETVDFFFDPVTFQVVRTERVRRSEENMDLQIPSILEFSDYRLVGNLYVPFRVLNVTGNAIVGQHQSTLIVSSVNLNSNLPDSLFSPAEGGQ